MILCLDGYILAASHAAEKKIQVLHVFHLQGYKFVID